ncbi:MAG: hypothetical protein IJF13_09870 [Clostridia bacterium]|nr:hypothetical protein [Clostridia bacterium]
MKRTIALLIVLSMMLGVLVACSGGSDDSKDTGKTPTTTAPSETTADPNAITTYLEPLDESLTALDYGGDKTITIIARNLKNKWAANELWVEEITNDPVKDSVYNRNAAVCDILGLKEIIQVSAEDQDELQQKVNVMVGSGDQTYDIVAASVAYGTPMINQGLMYNLYDNGIDTYLDAEKPWWSQYWIEQAEMGDRLYCITGAPALSLTRLMFVMYYNKDLGAELQVEDMYTVVDEGRWTIDYLNELIPDMYRSLNGDDVRDEEDQYGLAINHYENCDMFWSAFDMTMISKDEDGWFEMDTTGKEKISNAFEKVFYLIRENPGTYDTVDTKGFDVGRDMFASGNLLFTALHLSYAESQELRNMQDEYGILPIPKYDERQDNYYTYAHDQYTVFMVPKTVANPEMSGAVLETMAYESYKTVQPTYYDMVLKGRYANDPQSRKMLDTITQNVKVDPAWIYGRQLALPAASVFRDLIYDGKKSFATAYAKQERMLPFSLKEMKQIVSGFDF